MRSINVKFDGFLRADFNSEASGLMASVNAAAINILQPESADKFFPNRGAGLREAAIIGYIADQSGALHAAKFASFKTELFLKTYMAGHPKSVKKLVISPKKLSGDKLTVTMSAESEDGLEIFEEVMDIW